jgi:anti-anti-sigma factor
MAITVSEKEGVVIFRLSGRIITPGVKEVSETVEEALAVHSSPPRLVFDFKEVTGMDSSGLGMLMKIYTKIYPRGGKIAVINVNKHVKNLIVMARLITVFKNFESEDDAVAALLQHPE